MTTRDDLYRLVDQLLDCAHWLVSEEDNPLNEDELERVREGEATLEAGDYVTLEQLRREV
jgi:hypothetical protein